MSMPVLVRLVAAAALIAAVPVHAQVRTVDPNIAMQDERQPPPPPPPPPRYDSAPVPVDEGGDVPDPPFKENAAVVASDGRTARNGAPPSEPGPNETYQEDDIFGAAEGVFGKGAKGLAKMIEKILKQQGRPNAYIAGREAGGAFVAGLRYGSGTLHHKVEGDRPVYWTGPSIGFDVGANGAKTFVLVYNLYDGNDLFRRFPAAEGDVYVIGGLTASYMRRGSIVLIPIRLGVGWRLGANLGYMRFSKTAKWVPF